MKRVTHLASDGTAHMVDIGNKTATERSAKAEGRIRMAPDALAALVAGDAPKGDVFGTARIAGIMAAKKTGELIPLCHPLGLDSIVITFEVEESVIRVSAIASLTGRTGVEMEAMTAVSVALLTLYDMGKALDKGMVIEDVRLLSKSGGKSGEWKATD